mgnify:CR=1 FL=1
MIMLHGVESNTYVSQTHPNAPPTIKAASRSVAILIAWPSPAYKGSCGGAILKPMGGGARSHNSAIDGRAI